MGKGSVKMIDIEKVIKGLKQHREARLYSCDDCPYTNETNCQSKLCSDALALLEEQQKLIDEITQRRTNNGAFN
jgi:hypothetical protein